jgi:CheY-like chemotaxis protein
MPANSSASLSILVVDDNVADAHTMARLLRMWGHEVRITYDGRKGVEAAKVCRPDLILMDIGMPLLNGFEAARLVRMALGQAVTLVAVTAYSGDSDRAEGREAGFDYYVVKPAQFSDLRRIVSELAGHKAQEKNPADIGALVPDLALH